MPFAKRGNLPEHKPSGPARFWKITENELSEIVALCTRGTDPQTATIKILGISRTAFHNWRNEAEREDGDERYKFFFAQLGQAFASRRAACSERVADEDPLSWLTRGPGGRSTPDYPGWTQEQVVRHADHTGDGPMTLRVKIIVGRLGIKSEVIEETRRLTDGNDSGE